MTTAFLRDNTRSSLQTFYQSRTERLKTLTLDDLLPWIPRHIDLFGTHDAFDLVKRMIESYLASFEVELNHQTSN